MIGEPKLGFTRVKVYGQEKALNAIDKDPEIINKLKVFADMVLATNTSPIPARVEHKGFFNFGKAE